MTEHDHDAPASDRGFLEWMAEEVEARVLRAVPPGEREEARREFRAALGRLLATAPMPRGEALAELAGRARIAAAFRVTYGDDPADDPSGS